MSNVNDRLCNLAITTGQEQPSDPAPRRDSNPDRLAAKTNGRQAGPASTLKEFLETEQDEVYRRYREEIPDERRGSWVAQMIKVFTKLGLSHPEARGLSVAETPAAQGEAKDRPRGERITSRAESHPAAWTATMAKDGPVIASGSIPMGPGWERARRGLDALFCQLEPEAKEAWARKIANYGSALAGQLAVAKFAPKPVERQQTHPVHTTNIK